MAHSNTHPNERSIDSTGGKHTARSCQCHSTFSSSSPSLGFSVLCQNNHNHCQYRFAEHNNKKIIFVFDLRLFDAGYSGICCVYVCVRFGNTILMAHFHLHAWQNSFIERFVLIPSANIK